MKRLWLTEVFKAGMCAAGQAGRDCGSFPGWVGRKSMSGEIWHRRQRGKVEANTNAHAGACS